jgi:zinc transporter ZupT
VTLNLYKAFAAVLIFLTAIAIAYLLKKKSGLKAAESIEWGDALASGIFLGAAFFHMLPDATQTFRHVYPNQTFPLSEAICVAGFLLLLMLERLSLIYSSIPSKNTVPIILGLILIIHAVTEGVALGIGSTFPETLMLFIAILAHKGSESFAFCITLLKQQIPFRKIFFIIVFFALMTPLGIGIGAMVNEFSFARHGEIMAATFNAFAAGTFLYISTLHHIHFHQHTHDTQGLLEFISLVFGATIMGVIALWN